MRQERRETTASLDTRESIENKTEDGGYNCGFNEKESAFRRSLGKEVMDFKFRLRWHIGLSFDIAFLKIQIW